MSFCTVGLPNHPHFFGNVDRYRAPCDAAAATDTAGSLKLIDPSGQFVAHPLPVARESRRPHRATVDVRMGCSETRIPSSPALRVIACQIRYFFDSAAEASGADHRTVC